MSDYMIGGIEIGDYRLDAYVNVFDDGEKPDLEITTDKWTKLDGTAVDKLQWDALTKFWFEEIVTTVVRSLEMYRDGD